MQVALFSSLFEPAAIPMHTETGCDQVMLYERDDSLAALTAALRASSTSGQLVSVSGEAGIGKSSLLQEFSRQRAAGRWLWGYCEALATPRPLGPLLDLAPELGGETAAALKAGASRHDLFAAMLADLREVPPGTVGVFEDVHWADEATLDLLHFLARRIGHTHAVVVITWRDDEIGPDHAIHRVLSSSVPAVTHRIRLEPLSIAAVQALTAGRVPDPAAVHSLTGGNPFFVTELANAAPGTVPASVRDAVLARRALLGVQARAVLDLVSVVPARAEIGLIEEAVANAREGLEGCVTAGLLRCDARTAAFRHELARLAVADALPAPRTQDCHRRVLGALLGRADRAAVLARIVHHAESCGDSAAVIEYAPEAARQASTLGAHRQAVDHYRRVLLHADSVPPTRRLAFNEALSYEHYLTGDIETARRVRHQALTVALMLGDTAAVGRNVRWLSRLAWFAGDRDEAYQRAEEAIRVLSALPAGEELAMAFSNRAQLHMLNGDTAPCLEWGAKAIELARALDAHEVLSHALNNVGTVRRLAGEAAGRAQLVESLELALARDFHEHAARAYTNLSSSAIERREYDDARHWLDAGLAYTSARDLESWTSYMLAYRARLRAETGFWNRACDDAEAIIAAPGAAAVSRIPALAVLGGIRARRGDPGAAAVLNDALALARRTGESQRLGPVQLARAEMACFAGDRAATVEAARDALRSFSPDSRSPLREAFWYWLWRAGALEAGEISGDTPFVTLMLGDWRAAAEQWHRIGCPYERALCLAEGDTEAMRTAVETLQVLGAAPALDWVRQRLRQAGLAVTPRGRRSTTLAHPAGLTVREAEILDLLALGLYNPQIAERLFVSAKTVEHHVSAILAKLDVPSREAAVEHARRQGWLEGARGTQVRDRTSQNR